MQVGTTATTASRSTTTRATSSSAIDGQRFPVFDDLRRGRARRRRIRYLRHARPARSCRPAPSRRHAADVQLRSTPTRWPRRTPLEQRRDHGQGAWHPRAAGTSRGTRSGTRVDAIGLGAADGRRRRRSSCAASRTSWRNLGNPPVAGPVGIVDIVGPGPQRSCRRSSWSGSSACCRPTSPSSTSCPSRRSTAAGSRSALIKARQSRRASSHAAERGVYLAGFALLMAFLVWISYFDIGGGSAAVTRRDRGRHAGRRPTATVDVGGVLVGSRSPGRGAVDDQHRHGGRRRDGASRSRRSPHAGSELVRITVNNDATPPPPCPRSGASCATSASACRSSATSTTTATSC